MFKIFKKITRRKLHGLTLYESNGHWIAQLMIPETKLVVGGSVMTNQTREVTLKSGKISAISVKGLINEAKLVKSDEHQDELIKFELFGYKTSKEYYKSKPLEVRVFVDQFNRWEINGIRVLGEGRANGRVELDKQNPSDAEIEKAFITAIEFSRSKKPNSF